MLGKKVKCKVTGLKGIATSKVTYINGCVQYRVTPKADKSNNMPRSEYIDTQELKIIGDGVTPGMARNKIDGALGMKAICPIIGFKGIITAELIEISGSVKYCIKPKSKVSNKTEKGYYINSYELKITGKGIDVEPTSLGGPQRDMPNN